MSGPGEAFRSESPHRAWLCRQVDHLLPSVADDELGIEHPNILLGLPTCRCIRPTDMILYERLHPVDPLSNIIDSLAFFLEIERCSAVEKAGIESIKWGNGGKVILPLNKVGKDLFHAFIGLTIKVLDNIHINLVKGGSGLVIGLFKNGNLLFSLDGLIDTYTNLILRRAGVRGQLPFLLIEILEHREDFALVRNSGRG